MSVEPNNRMDYEWTAKSCAAAAPASQVECEAASVASAASASPVASPAASLMKSGVVVLPILSPTELAAHRKAVLADMRAFPEYKPAYLSACEKTGQMPTLVMGGFGALGNPSSFHSQGVLALRERVSTHVRSTILPAYVALQNQANTNRWPSQQPHVETLMDRLSVRRTGTSTGAETWHIDQSPIVAGREAHPDVVFGGWINLDATEDQFFSCKKGTHDRPYSGQTGFVALTAAEQSAAKHSPSDMVRIPPGHFMLFHQTLTHEVLPRKAKHDSMRLYVGFRLTISTRALFDECVPAKEFAAAYPNGFDFQRDVVLAKGVPPLPSGQYPPMFSSNHWNCSYSPAEWSRDAFKPEFVTYTTSSNKRTVPRYMVAAERKSEGEGAAGPSGGKGAVSYSSSAGADAIHRVYSHSTTPLQRLKM